MQNATALYKVLFDYICFNRWVGPFISDVLGPKHPES